MMKRHELAITIAKINKTTKLLRHWLGLGQEEYSSALDTELSQLGSWIRNVRGYLKANPDGRVYEMLGMICTEKDIKAFIERYGDVMPNKVHHSLLVYIPIMEKLLKDGAVIRTKAKPETEYRDLADGLDNPEVASLLKRAQDINILDAHFKPMPDIYRKQLKVLAFAVKQLVEPKMRLSWNSFDEQWPLPGTMHLSNLRLPDRNNKRMRLITDLFPEVDFTDLFFVKTDEPFWTRLSGKQIGSIYRSLRDNDYISKETTHDDFHSLFKPVKDGKVRKVEWTGTQNQLSFFVYHAFKDRNKLTLWVKASNRFLVNGHTPNKDTLSSFLTHIKKKGQLCTYDTKLMEIVKAFMY